MHGCVVIRRSRRRGSRCRRRRRCRFFHTVTGRGELVVVTAASLLLGLRKLISAGGIADSSTGCDGRLLAPVNTALPTWRDDATGDGGVVDPDARQNLHTGIGSEWQRGYDQSNTRTQRIAGCVPDCMS